MLFVTDGVDPGDIAAFPQGGSARAALVVAADGGGAEVADWSRRADVATVAVSIDDGDVRAVQRALASSLARAAAAEGRLQDDGWLLALPAGLLVLLWFRRGTTLRWGRWWWRSAFCACGACAGGRAGGLVLDAGSAGAAVLRGARLRRGCGRFRGPGVARDCTDPAGKIRGGGRDAGADPDLGRAIQPGDGVGAGAGLPGGGGGIRGGAGARSGKCGGGARISRSRSRSSPT